MNPYFHRYMTVNHMNILIDNKALNGVNSYLYRFQRLYYCKEFNRVITKSASTKTVTDSGNCRKGEGTKSTGH